MTASQRRPDGSGTRARPPALVIDLTERGRVAAAVPDEEYAVEWQIVQPGMVQPARDGGIRASGE
jgi:hypothetical protein